jgi:pimeloyl-ACP methyl ester carboxylesterase/AcrR family transcriptional regulator
MAKTSVKCTSRTTAGAAEVWAVAQDFARPWHPMVERMRGETGPQGAVLRHFRADGGDYLEQRSYRSHSDHVLAYRLLEGIEGIRSYNARLQITDNGQGASLHWSADIEAGPDRLPAIAAGTKAVFDAGLEYLCKQEGGDQIPAPIFPEPATVQSCRFGKSPELAMDVAPAGLAETETLCIYLHGIGGQRSNWDLQLAALGAVVPSVALDLRGYGDSGLGAGQTTVEDYCNDILALAERFKAKRLILAGLSYGSWIATSFAMRHPERLAGLVLAGGCTGMSEASEAECEAFRHARQVPLDAGQTPADFAPVVVDIIAGPEAGDAVLEKIRASMAAIPAATYRDALVCFTTPPEQFDFGRIACPVLLMTGAYDRLAPPEEIRAVSERMYAASDHSDIEFEVIPDAGHLCNLEAPVAFNRHLLGFLQRVGKGSAAPVLSSKETRRLAKQQRILEAALAEFAKHGFSGASMQAIAERAGVSKPTLYQYFGHKQDLLAAVLNVGKSELLAPLQDTGGKSLVDVLWQFSWTYADFVLRPDMLSLARLMIGEAERLPDVARDYQNHGPRKALQGTIAFLLAQRGRGALRFQDAELAAQNLWSLILSAPREYCLHHPDERPTRAELARYIRNGLGVFLRAYSTDVAKHTQDLGRIAVQDEGERNG